MLVDQDSNEIGLQSVYTKIEDVLYSSSRTFMYRNFKKETLLEVTSFSSCVLNSAMFYLYVSKV